MQTRVSSDLDCWCQAGRWQGCFRTARFGLLRCTACGCYRIDPVPLLTSDAAAAFYTEYYQQQEPPPRRAPEALGNLRASRFWRVVDQVPSLAEVRQAVADIGCGEGGLCAELKAAGWPSVVGVEVSRARIERARQRHPGIQFYDCPLEESDIAEESLDLAVMDNVIEHLPDPLEMLRQIRRHLSPNGRCVLMTPNMQSGNFRLLGRRWTPELAPHAHIFLFTEEALNESLRVAGFDVETSGTFHPQCAPSWEILRSTNLKEAVWRLMQAAGSLYARCIRQGPMLYAVATPSNQQSADHKAGGDRASGTET